MPAVLPCKEGVKLTISLDMGKKGPQAFITFRRLQIGMCGENEMIIFSRVSPTETE